jgi:hypothetical protein
MDDFRRLVLRSNDGTAEVFFRRDADGRMVYEQDGMESHVPEAKVLETVENFVRRGFGSLTCECWSGDVHVEVPPDGRGKIKISYCRGEPPCSPSVVIPGLDEAKHIIDPEEANQLLRAIDVVTADGSIRADMRRKYVQIDNFVKLIHPLLNKSTQRGKVFILDCGCGKSYLSFVMNYFLREKLRRSCHFFCIDANPDLIGKCLQMRDELGYSNMEFRVSKIRDFQPREKVDIVCSLHACDTASYSQRHSIGSFVSPYSSLLPARSHKSVEGPSAEGYNQTRPLQSETGRPLN